VVYQLATLNHPFESKNIISLGQNIVASTPKYIEKASAELNQMILDMLEKSPSKRLSADELFSKYFKARIPASSKLLN